MRFWCCYDNRSAPEDSGSYSCASYREYLCNVSILTGCKIRGIPGFGLLGETINPPDHRSSAATIEVLNKMDNLGLDVKPLLEQADEIEQSMHKISEEVQQSADTTPKKDLPMYG